MLQFYLSYLVKYLIHRLNVLQVRLIRFRINWAITLGLLFLLIKIGLDIRIIIGPSSSYISQEYTNSNVTTYTLSPSNSSRNNFHSIQSLKCNIVVWWLFKIKYYLEWYREGM
jgi:hypothetical protein